MWSSNNNGTKKDKTKICYVKRTTTRKKDNKPLWIDLVRLLSICRNNFILHAVCAAQRRLGSSRGVRFISNLPYGRSRSTYMYEFVLVP